MNRSSCFSVAQLVGLAVAGGLALSGCGGGSSSPSSQKFKIGGTVSGLVGTGLVLHSSLGDDLPVAASGPFTFPTTAAKGTAYEVTVKTQPSASETCTVSPQSGTVGSADVTVAVACSSQTFTVGGTVNGLSTAGLVLQNNGGTDLPVAATDTSFTFTDKVADGGNYAVTVKTSATGSSCSVASGGTGTIHGANVTNVVVTCTTGVVQRWQSPSTSGVTQAYTRNRQALFPASGGGYQLLGANDPRIDSTKGYLFGLQGANRLTNPDTNAVVGEAFDLWSSAGATVQADALEAPDGGTTADLITLPQGASLTAAIRSPFYSPNASPNPGPIHALIWIRRPAATTSGTLHFSMSGTTPTVDVQLSSLSADTWTPVWLKGLTTTGVQTADVSGTYGSFTMTSTAGSATFYAWGADLTQISEGGDLGSFNPGAVMYDKSATSPVDVLDLETAVPEGTASTGFCLSVDAQPYDGLGWTTPFVFKRGLMAWFSGGSGTSGATASLYVTGTHVADGPGRLCFYVSGQSVAPPNDSQTIEDVTCGPVPPQWAAGSKHNVKGCVSASDRTMRLYADDAVLVSHVLLTNNPIPDLQGGHLVIGNTSGANSPAWAPDPSVPWNGYVSKALACRESADRATMCQ